MLMDGVICEDRDLKGDETLADLVHLFTRKSAMFGRSDTQMIPQMIPVVKKHELAMVSEREKGIRERVNDVLSGVYMASETANMRRAVDILVTEYVCGRVAFKYDELDPALFELQRELAVRVNNRDVEIDIPLFASCALRGKSTGWSYQHKESEKDSYGRDVNHQIDFSSAAPPITAEAKEAARQAECDFYEAYARALRDPRIGKWLFRPDAPLPPMDFAQVIYWIPRPQDLGIQIKTTVVDKDPVLITNINGRKFLVAAWNVEGEEPYQHYLGAFRL
jgi:hypothetical protein